MFKIYGEIEMSDTEHKKGKLIPTGKNVENFVNEYLLNEGQEIPDCYEDALDFFNDQFYRCAIVHNGIVYTVETKEINPYDDIYTSSENKDLSIDFEVKFYNGGCSFSEAIQEALKPLKTTI